MKRTVKNMALTGLILLGSLGMSILLQQLLHLDEHVSTMFVFAVFLISLLTDGFLYGLFATFVGVFAVNYAFTPPYFFLDLSATTSIFSALVMLVISLLTSGLMLKLKKGEALKAEGERERVRADLLRAVSHDMRTPLTTIYGATSSVLDNFDKLTGEQKKSMLRGVKEDAEWLIGLVENLLSITRVSSSEINLVKQQVVLEELVDAVLIKFKKHYPDETVVCDIPERLVVIPMDAILIKQVMLNMLENVVHHAKEYTRITLKVQLCEGQAVFEISDDGCGIEPEKLSRIFQGRDAGLTEAFGDTKTRNAGIGLSVCSTIIKAHGGHITAENAPEGGAVFRFSLMYEEETGEQ